MSLLLLIIGLLMLLGGGDALVRGSVGLATRLRVSPTIIGLTIVAFGTSTPELVVNLTAAFRGTAEMAFGNVVGSNIANVGLLLGVCASFRALEVHRTIVLREAPMMVLVCVASLAMIEDHLAGRVVRSEVAAFDRGDGIVLLLLFSIFIYYTVGDAIRQRATDAYVHEVEEIVSRRKPMHPLVIALCIVGGLAVLVVGGQLTVKGGSELALSLGVPEVVVALSLVAVGTSLPELATSVAAVRRGQTDIAVGNIVGSNIYNLGFVLGLTSIVKPIPLPRGGVIDLIVMTSFGLALLPLITTQSRLSRLEGSAILAGYIGYIGWLATRG